MKLQFKTQSFQTDAVNAVCDLFSGQERNRSTFSLDMQPCTGNVLVLKDEDILSNMHAVQKRGNLPQTNDREGRQFCVEMETGTGKTYVYTKTIFELNRLYGFTKFIIVVPSVAIREGVFKSFQITREHFAAQYDNVPCRVFIYNSAKLSDVRQFATSTNIEIMIINIDAFKKAENVINQEHEKLDGEKAITFIRGTAPVVIIDEPQSVDNTPKAKDAIASLSPLCVFRYSATHREKINLLYRLTPVDAYQMGLVKQISVSSNSVEQDFNKPYIRLLSVSNANGFTARIEIDKMGKDGKVTRQAMTVGADADLYRLSGNRDMYEGYEISGIDCTPGFESVEFANTEMVQLGKAIGGIDELLLKRAQIRRTIEVHFQKELLFHRQGIKVLSLFFIDEVQKYRLPDGSKGVYAHIFEECYSELISLPRFAELREMYFTPETAHDGYFSQDKKGYYKNTNGDTQDDYSTYNTIMKDKEWLLSFECPLRFIFSHSTLKEGWDNPNVFQVCTLIEQKSTFTCRQKVGRGLRLCVDQQGNRIEDRNINILHVMANESFAEFAEGLQKEIEEETGVRFGALQISLFSGMGYEDQGQPLTLSYENAAELVKHFEQSGYIDNKGKIKEPLRAAIQTGTLKLPGHLEAARNVIVDTIVAINKFVPIRDASKDVRVKLKKQVLVSPEFIELWDKIKQKTTYRVQFDVNTLISRCAEKLRDLPPLMKAKIINQTVDINIRHEGVSYTEREMRSRILGHNYTSLPDILTVVGEATLTKRATVYQILRRSEKIKEFLDNPQLFIEQVIETIKSVRHEMAIDGIRYVKLDGQEYYVQEVFNSVELIANLDRNAVPVKNSVYDYVIFDSSTVEKPFAQALDNDPDVKMFFKLPDRFTIETPIGTYNPDWAVYLLENGEEKLYLVLETKGTIRLDDLRTPERLKIHCGKRHFEALGDMKYFEAKDWKEFKLEHTS